MSRDKSRPKKVGSALVFSEKDLPGYKRKSFTLRDPNDDSQGRSFLYEKNKREIKKRENKKRFEPYARRPIPKQTAITGFVSAEYECTPVQNDEYWALEKQKTETMLKIKERPATSFTDLKPANFLAAGNVITLQDRSAINKVSQRPNSSMASLLTPVGTTKEEASSEGYTNNSYAKE